jgi:hypothetical protein
LKTGTTIESSGVIRQESSHYISVQLVGPVPKLVAVLTAGLGVFAVSTYAAAGLTLAHYDAKAHLVVARRILDSITPGWEQVGAVWLPLPHLLNMLPAQIDVLYRTGAFAILLSVLAHALAAGSLAATVQMLTRSTAGGVAAAALYATNPNVLYLQSTPMTEPLLFGLTAWQVLLFTRWATSGALSERPPASLGWVTILACMTRYEAWPITGLLFATSAFAWWRGGTPFGAVRDAHARLAAYPLGAVLAFLAFSRVTVGEWFVSGGFYVPDETLRGRWDAVIEKIGEGVATLGGERLLGLAKISAIGVLAAGVIARRRAALLIPLSLFGAAALPLFAYYAGHPFRIRYEIALVVAAAAAVGLAVGLTRALAKPIAAAVVLAVFLQRPPFDASAPMIAEAQLDTPAGRARQAVTACLQTDYHGGAIMASMGALGHYMHELSAAGFDIADFLHEGNGPIWDSAFTRGPAPLVEWVMVEEVAEGGDAVIQRHRQIPRLLEDYDRVCGGGNVSLYRRRAR